MANTVKGEVELRLKDGRAFTLVADMEALVEAETIYGKPLPRLMKDAGEGFMGAACALLQGMLARHHDVNRADALQMLASNMEAVSEALNAASQAAFGNEESDDKGEVGNDPDNQAGKNSGGNGASKASTRKPSGKRPRKPSA